MNQKLCNELLILEKLATVNTCKCEIYGGKQEQDCKYNRKNIISLCKNLSLCKNVFKTGIKCYVMNVFLILPHTREAKQFYSCFY